MSAAEWIARRREKTTLFRDRFGDTAGVGGVVALVAEDLPRALDALEAVLEVVRLHRREPATDGSVDEYDYVGELADEFERAIESALRCES